MKLTIGKDYKEERRKAYMEVGEQLDAILALANTLKENGLSLPEKVEDWISHCSAVKSSISK